MIFVSSTYYKTQMDYGSGFHQKLAYVLCIVFVISYSIFALIVLYIRNIHRKVEWMLSEEVQMKEQQVMYYEALLKREEETRKYRHDMNAHIMFLDSMAKDGDFEGIRSYLAQMTEHMQEIRRSVYTTGIRALDSILNYYLTEVQEEVAVKVSGRCELALEISDMDFCTVFSNLLRNMVEAVNACDVREPALSIRITEGMFYVQILMENSVNEGRLALSEEGLPLSSKMDKKNHGYGIGNVKEVIQKNEGKFEYGVKEGSFWYRVILKKKKE